MAPARRLALPLFVFLAALSLLPAGASGASGAGTDATTAAAPGIEGLMNLDEITTEGQLFTETADLRKLKVNVASSRSRSVFESISTVSIIDREQIERYNFQTVAEAVRTLAGIDVSRTHLKQNLPTARGMLQPHYANKVLVLLDGVPTWNAVTGEGTLERVNVRDVKRIEVLKGPASVKYGSNAYSGAINIVLLDGGEERTSGAAYAGAGSDGNRHVGARYLSERRAATSSDRVYLSVLDVDGFDYQFKDELNVTAPIQDYVRNKNVTWSHRTGAHHLLLNAYDGGEGYLGVTPKNSAGAGQEHELDGLLLNYTFDRALGARDRLKAYGTFDRNQRTLARNLTDRSDVLGVRFVTGLSFQRQESEAFTWELGFDHDARTSERYRNYNAVTGVILNENNLFDKSVTEQSLFTNLTWDWKRLIAAAGYRYTDNELFGSNSSLHVTLVRPLDKQRSLKLIYAESYRAPSLFELNFETAPPITVYGNRDLDPERSTSWELAYLQQRGDLFFQSTVYAADYYDKILRTRGDGTSPTGVPFVNQNHYANGEEFSALGVEFELNYRNPRPRGFSGRLNLGYVNGDDSDRFVDGADTGTFNFQSVPVFKAMLGLERNLGDRVAASAAVNYRGAARDTEQLEVDSVTTVDLNFRVAVSRARDCVDVSFKNLFDEESLIPEYSRPTSALSAVPAFDYGRSVVVTYTRRF